jgi:hypothetical protein
MRYFPLATILIVGGLVLMPAVSNALTVSPPRIELAGNPGTNVVGEFALFNEQDETKTFYSSFENFEARGEGGTPYFTGCSVGGLCSWLKTDSQATLKPGERKIFPFTITIPKNAEPGGHFAAIFWGTAPPQVGGGQVAIGGKVGILVLLRVAGETKEKGGLLEFKTDGGRVLTSLPITFEYRFSNDGGDRIKPEGKITLKNIFGMMAAETDANKSEGNVLPGSVRQLTALWHSRGQRVGDLTKKEELALMTKIAEEGKEKKSFFEAAGSQWSNFAFGLYKAELNLTYGKDAKTAAASYRFFVIPWQLLSIIIFILALLGLGGWFGLKKYNRWIISKHISRDT